MELDLRSPAFMDGQNVPNRFTANGENLSPPLSWSGVPTNAYELLLLCEDAERLVGPNLGPHLTNATSDRDRTFVHWILTGIPAETTSLPEGLPRSGLLTFPEGAKQGINSFGRIGYSGPDPRDGHGTHRYLFRLFAVDRELILPSGANRDDCLRALDGTLLNEGLLIGVAQPAVRAA